METNHAKPNTPKQAPADALTGVRIIDLGQLVAAPFATHLMADFGAEVIKVELPGKGDAMRQWGHAKYKGKGLWWPSINRNKKCITLNLRAPKGQALLKKLVVKSDVLIENFRTGIMERWGIGPEVLQKANPRLIIARITGYGQTGPYAQRAGFASVGEAMGGLRYINGYPGEIPPRMGISLGDDLAGMFAAHGIMMALYWRDALGGGRGQIIDSSIMESCFALIESAVSEYDKTGYVREPAGSGLAGIAPSNVYKSKDGKLMIIAANIDTMYQRLCEAMGRPELISDPRYSTHEARGKHKDEMDAIVGEWASRHDAKEIDRILNEVGVVCGPIYSIEDIFEDPQYKARDMIVHAQDPELGALAMPGIVPKMSVTSGQVEWPGSQQMGSHNEEIYGNLLGISQAEMDELKAEGII
ncbi:MAG TPA: CoA transferase [Desulfobacterales bacterium]|nr:CoA transferase [Desulfobacterales bacterium]